MFCSAVLVLSAAALAACGPGTCLNLKDVSYQLLRSDDMLQGKEAPVVLKVTNKSTLFMLVKTVTGQQLAKAAPSSLVGSEPGTLTRDEKGAAWVHDPKAQGETEERFAWGLVSPGGKLEVEVRVAPQTADGTLTACYIGLSAEEVARWVYFPKDAADSSLTVYELRSAAEVDGLAAAAGKAGTPDKVVLHERLLTASPRCEAEMPYTFVLKKP
jgi:hypothetical protein